jgi:hypothetical protein
MTATTGHRVTLEVSVIPSVVDNKMLFHHVTVNSVSSVFKHVGSAANSRITHLVTTNQMLAATRAAARARTLPISTRALSSSSKRLSDALFVVSRGFGNR